MSDISKALRPKICNLQKSAVEVFPVLLTEQVFSKLSRWVLAQPKVRFA